MTGSIIVLGAVLASCIPTGKRSERVPVSPPAPRFDASVVPPARDASAPADRASVPEAPVDRATGPDDRSPDLLPGRCITPSRDSGFRNAGPAQVWVDPSTIAPAELAERLTRWLFRVDPPADVTARLAECSAVTVLHVRALAEQLIDDPRAEAGLQLFFSKWLQLDRLAGLAPDPSVFPLFGPAAAPGLAQAMASEVSKFGVHVARLGGPSFATLLTAPFSFVDGQLAPIYGLTGIAPGAPFALTVLPPDDERSGILTMPALLGIGMFPTRNSPPVRGRLVFDRLLCGFVPDPPPDLPPEVPAPAPGKTIRQTMEALLQPICRPCHALIDIGWAFEMFDAIGQHRTLDNGGPIDSRATLTWSDATVTSTRSVMNPRQLAQALLDSGQAADCFVDRLFANSLGLDEPIVDRLTSATTPALRHNFQQGNGNIRQLILDIASTADFHRQRR
jgi:hypothetical protein